MIDYCIFQERKQWVAYIGDSPKPPPERITFTLPIINNAKRCIFYVTGAQKAQILKVKSLIMTTFSNDILIRKSSLKISLCQPEWSDLNAVNCIGLLILKQLLCCQMNCSEECLLFESEL